MFKFIKATKEYNTFEKNVPAPYIRKSFFSDTKAKAKLMIAVCGFYELYINGKRYTKGFLAPYISNTDDYIYYDEYDVEIDCGENVIGIVLGNGFQNNPGGYIWDFDKATFRSAPMVALMLTYKNASDTDIKIESDGTFKTANSPIRADDYRFGEYYDANYEIRGWNEKGFDDSNWENAIETNPPRGELRRCEAEPIIKETELKPTSITRVKDGYIYDFGVNNAGICRLNISGKKGQKVELQHGEVVKDGELYFDHIWFKRELWERDIKIVHKDIYILKGGENEEYTPEFTYHGFRYVKVTGIKPEQATKDLLTYLVIHSDLKSRGDFSCSNETINKLQEITRRSDLSNFYYFPTDCPQREKNGWTADAALSAEQMMLNFNPEVSYREWMRNICKAQNDDGALPGIIPTGGWGFEWGNGPAWDCVLAYIPYYVYIYRGETDIIKESAHAFMAYLDYLTTVVDEKGLIHIGLGDWCHVGRSSEDYKAPLELTDTVISMDIAQKMSFMLKAIGRERQSKFAASVAEDLKKAIRDNLIDFDTMVASGNCQTSQAICLYYGVFNDDEKEIAFGRLLEMIEAEDGHMDIGVIGSKVIFHVLSSFDRSDLAFNMIVREDFPSYGAWIKKGDTTLREIFSRDDRAGSMNHHFWGDISAWFIKRLAGIQFNPRGNDIKSVEIRPAFVDSLENAEGYYTAPDGKISSSWKRTEGGVVMSMIIPEKIDGEIILPTGYAFYDGSVSKKAVTGEYEIKKIIE